MTGIEIAYLVLSIVFVLAAAFFASAEVAFIGLQKVKLRNLEESGVRGAERVASIMEYPGKFLSTVLTGFSFTETIVVTLGSMLIVSLIGNEAIGTPVSIVVMTVVLLLFVKVIPKTIASTNPEQVALYYAGTIAVLSKVLSPVVSGLSWIANKFTSLIGGHIIPGALLSKEEVNTAISMGEESGTVEKTSADMLRQVLAIGDRQVQEIMTPQDQAYWMEQGTTLAQFLDIYAEASHPRYPIYEKDHGNVKGVLAARDVLLALALGSVDRGNTVADFLRPAHVVPESKLVGELLTEMQDRKSETAVMVDDYGAPSGIITISQLAQQIMGDLRWTLADAEEGERPR
ncbi:MAG: hemolysin family protein [Dehalococcoidia bacterium]